MAVVTDHILYFSSSNPEDTIGCRLVFCGWKARVSTRVQISKFDKAHYQVLCGVPPDEKHKGTHLLFIIFNNNYRRRQSEYKEVIQRKVV